LKGIGLFGGTFNPIHLGHIQVIREVKTGFGLDKIFIIPSALPPHKKPCGVVAVEDRLEMIRLAFSNDPNYVVSDVELRRSGPSYTIDTVRHFTFNSPGNEKFYLIVGLDAFLEVDTWKSHEDLFHQIPFIVMSRPVKGEKFTGPGSKSLEIYIKSRISKGYTFSPAQSSYIHEKKHPIFFFNVTPVDISSTMIREHIKNGRSVKHLVPETIEDYITAKGLYL